MQTFNFSGDGATFSPCEQYRYRLWRNQSGGSRVLNFIMLNPSTADEVNDDPTVARCGVRTRVLGFDRLVVTNIFAWRSTDPRELTRVTDPIGHENNSHLIDVASHASLVVCAWGRHGRVLGRAEAVVKMLHANNVKLHALRVSDLTGQPEHPLYLPYNLEPTTWIGDLQTASTRPDQLTRYAKT